MTTSPDALSEQARLDSLEQFDVLDTPQEEAFDRITRLLCQLLDVPMSTVTLIDGHRQWFKSRQGLLPCEGDKESALCTVTISQAEPLIVPDTLADPRFAKSPLVTGGPAIRFYAGVPLRTRDGHNIGTLCAADTVPRDLTKQQITALEDLAKIVMSELELRLLVSTDGLTSALSRRAFRDEASRAVALALRHRHDLSLLVLDLDHFKTVNDTYGHATGDVALRSTISVCNEILRKSDLVGRIGGEEFAVLLPHTKSAAAMALADKLRSAIARQSVQTRSGTLNISASFGVTSLDQAVSSVDELLQRADTALYEAKRDGRNRCVFWTAPASIAPFTGARRVLKAGRITFNSGRSTIDCTVRALSARGASVDVVSSADIPDTFKLQIEADNFSGLCHIAAKTHSRLELAFAA